jgi:hypothetical protein
MLLTGWHPKVQCDITSDLVKVSEWLCIWLHHGGAWVPSDAVPSKQGAKVVTLLLGNLRWATVDTLSQGERVYSLHMLGEVTTCVLCCKLQTPAPSLQLTTTLLNKGILHMVFIQLQQQPKYAVLVTFSPVQRQGVL